MVNKVQLHRITTIIMMNSNNLFFFFLQITAIKNYRVFATVTDSEPLMNLTQLLKKSLE